MSQSLAKILSDIARGLWATPEGQRELTVYREMQKHPGWKAHQVVLATVAQELKNRMVRRDFTDLPPAEKDSQQRAYAMVHEAVEFLLNPMAYVDRQAAVSMHNQAMQEATRKGSDRKKGNT